MLLHENDDLKDTLQNKKYNQNTFKTLKVRLNTSNNNTFLGNYSGFNTGLADNNTFIGMYSGFTNIDGKNNTCLGYNSGYTNTDVILFDFYLQVNHLCSC